MPAEFDEVPPAPAVPVVAEPALPEEGPAVSSPPHAKRAAADALKNTQRKSDARDWERVMLLEER
jgi:hypothetical protein